jgi:O-antigen/teichoic acid export membrane protein
MTDTGGSGGRDLAPAWALDDTRQLGTIARNVTTRYIGIAVETAIGLVMLPFNLQHLGQAAYGLWMLMASITVHFSILDMGYGGSLVKFIAEYRARRDARALNEIASTLFFVFLIVGVVAYLVAILVAFNLGHFFRLAPEQAVTGRWLLLIVGLYISLSFAFSIFGGVTSGFQRYDANNIVAIGCAIVVAAVNAGVLLAGYGLVTLVACITAVRIATYFIYRLNAYRVYPPLRLRWSLVRRSRLREVTGFSVWASIITWANKLNYDLDELIIGAFLGASPVAVWAVADRIISATQRLTNQLNGVLFPVVVHSDTTNHTARLQRVFLEGTRFSLVMVVPIAVALFMLAHPLVHAWVGPRMAGSAAVMQVLAFAVAVRVGNATSTTLLKGAGSVRFVALVNIGAGLINLVLSALFIHRWGLVGVAFGTLIPVAAASIFVLFPAACRRVQLPVMYAARRSVWPALWPALIITAGLAVTRAISSGTLLAVLLQVVAAGLLYLTLFFGIAVGRQDRRAYVAKVKMLLATRRRLAPAA